MTPADRQRRLRDRVADAVLGADPSRRRVAQRGLLSLCAYAGSLGAEALGVVFGLADAVAVGALAAYLVAGIGLFFALARSGWSQRLADPSMTTPHVLFSMSAICVSYPIHGPFRGLNLLAIAVPPLFGFLAMRRRTSLAIVASVPVAFGAMMLALARHDPVRFDPRLEALHFAILAVCMTALGVLLWQIAGIRDRIRAQKVELSQALERIEAISTRDELTGLYNRRYMSARLEEEAARRARGAAAFCVCLIDLDHFKEINDLHGHPRGDAVLRGFARVLRSGLREADVLARWGGEEFLLLLPATTAAAALERLERLQRYSAELADWGDESPLKPRFSAGLCEDGGRRVDDILERADIALYQAKAKGRDRVVLATADAATA